MTAAHYSACDEGITVEDERFKRGARRTRKIARRLKRAARLTDVMASELQSSADGWFARISHGWAHPAPYAVLPDLGRPHSAKWTPCARARQTRGDLSPNLAQQEN